MVGLVNNIQKYSVHDGGGIRTVIFLQGCPLRCRWCSNPETQSMKEQRIYWKNKCIGCGKCVEVCPLGIGCLDLASSKCTMCLKCVDRCYAGALTLVAQEKTVEELVHLAARDTSYYRTSGGGVTLSGGEVLVQWEFAQQVLQKLQNMCIDTAIETTGFAPYEHLEAVAKQCNRVLYDVKHMDSSVHQEYVGVPNKLILENLAKLSRTGVEIVVRIPLIHNVNDSEENIAKTAEFAQSHGISRIDLLPFHRLGESKYLALHQPIEMPDATVPEEHVDHLKAMIESRGIKVSIGG